MTFCWQGWRVDLQSGWNPVKLEGDYRQGTALIADLYRPRLGLRWITLHRKEGFDADKWSLQLMQEEIGRLAAREARPFAMPAGQWDGSILYIEPDPPGRDVWLAFSRTSGRGLEVVHHVHRRQNLLAELILPTLSDLPADRPMPWAVFDLSCHSPAGWELASHRLNAGDLSLTFQNRSGMLIVRQVALARLAIKRMSLEKWLADQERRQNKYFRPVGGIQELELSGNQGCWLKGLSRKMVRRRRFFFLRRLPAELLTAALLDEKRDRLVILQASDDRLVSQAAESVGWAM